MSETCPIWGTPAEIRPATTRTVDVNSPRAGGWYRITQEAEASFPRPIEDRWRAKLTTWLVNQRRAGVEQPTILAAVVADIASSRALAYGDKVERFFLLLDHHSFNVGDVVDLTYTVAPNRTLADEIQAWCECASEVEFDAFLNLLEREGLIAPDVISAYQLTPAGFARLEEVARRRPSTRNVFVAMWFDQSMVAAFEEGIAPALTAAGYTPVRVDRLHHEGKIDDEIVAQIRRARFVVADFTCGTVVADSQSHAIPRGGVYYEAGFAGGLGIPVIWCVRTDQINAVHFDTRQFPHITWTTPIDLREALYNRVAALIGTAPGT
jgi:hypothetical protein